MTVSVRGRWGCGHVLGAAGREGGDERRALVVKLAARDAAIAGRVYDGHAPRAELREHVAQVARSRISARPV